MNANLTQQDSSSDELYARQQRALAEFKKLLPHLRSYASNVVGKRVSVEPGANNSTDGKTIYLRPPISLADRREHDRLECGERDYQGNQVCPACYAREDLIGGLHHEIAHIVHESFAEVPFNKLDYSFEGNLKKYLGDYAQESYHNWRYSSQYSGKRKARVMDMVRNVDPHLAVAWMSFEDVRINRASYEERPGLKEAHRARYQAILDNGIITAEGATDSWRYRPLDHQVIAAILFAEHGCRIAEYHLDPQATAVLQDKKLKKILGGIENMSSAIDAALLSLAVIQRLRQLGFMQIESQDQSEDEDEPEVEPQPQFEGGKSGGFGTPQEENSSESNDSEESGRESDSGNGSGEGKPSEAGDQGDAEQGDEPESDQDMSAQEGSGESEGDPQEAGESSSGGDSTDPGDDETGAGEPQAGSGDADVEPEASPQEPEDRGGQGGSVEPGSDADEADGTDEGNADGDSGEPVDQGESEPSGDGPAEPDGADEPAEASGEVEPASLTPKQGGSLEGLRKVLRTLFGHDEHSTEHTDVEVIERQEGGPQEADAGTEGDPMAKVIQAMWFLDRVPRNIEGIEVHEPGFGPAYSSHYRSPGSMKMPESLIGKAVTQARIAFSVNARVEHHRNQKAGRIASAALGKRAPLGDPRLFKKKVMPDKRNYAVLIGYDVSMSTVGQRQELIRDSVQALTEVCHRIGVDVAVYAHSTKGRGRGGAKVSISKVKDWKERWSKDIVQRLHKIGPVSGNLDGHTMQFYRKQLDAVRATHKILFYFTDGAMPAMNYEEELQVLQDEIKVCKQRGYTLLGVGIGTNSPEEHGLETVEVVGPSDIGLVVAKLQKKLAA